MLETNTENHLKTMPKFERWQGLPYYPISQFYKKLYGEKITKIPVSVVESCPNRDGLNGMKTCVFCDVSGSAAYPEEVGLSLTDQINENRKKVVSRTKAKKFLVYFQSYTNTFTRVKNLRKNFEEAAKFDDVLGFVVGTRPDCISEAVFDLWNDFSVDLNMFIELGVQSFDDKQLKWMERGHSAERSVKAIKRIREKCPEVNLGIHLMFGFPGETDEDIIEAAKVSSSLPIHNVKLHNLHVLKNTPLEKDYLAGDFEPIEKELYIHRVCLFLQHLSPKISVQRLSALAMRPEELHGSFWTTKKMQTYQEILDELKKRGAYQGQLWSE